MPRSLSVSLPLFRRGLLINPFDNPTTTGSVASVYTVFSPPSYKSRPFNLSSPSSSASSSSTFSSSTSAVSSAAVLSVPRTSAIPSFLRLPCSSVMSFSTIASRSDLLTAYPSLPTDVNLWLTEIRSPLETIVAKAVAAYLRLPSIRLQDEYLNQLFTQGGGYSGIEKVFHKVAGASSQALEFFFIIRSRCIDNRIVPLVTNQTIVWSPETIDNLAKEAITLLCGHTFVRMVQLSVAKPSQLSPTARLQYHPYDYEQARSIENLTSLAQKTETVHKTNDEAMFRYKFGNKRTVRALTHLARPHELFAVLYAAFLPILPASMHDIDTHSGGDPGTNGKWTYDELQKVSTNDLPTTVAFYSVGSSNPLVRGLGMGTRIIYTLANEIAHQLPYIRTFTTLSPIPEFLRWVKLTNTSKSNNSDSVVTTTTSVTLDTLLQQYQEEGNTLPYGITNGTLLVHELSTTAWYTSPGKDVSRTGTSTRFTELEPLLYWLCRYYLLKVRSGSDRYGKPSCKVAGFHLANGAQMYRICSRADTSDYGIKRSAGLMVNYVYSLSGAEGLEETMYRRAALYASNPKEVLDEQNPAFIVANTVPGSTPQIEPKSFSTMTNILPRL